MPSDSIAGFLDHAKAVRVLGPEQVEQLIRQPDVPQSDLAALCSYLLDRGVLTGFQAAAIREGRGNELSFGPYPVIDEIGPCAGGTAYRALHPSLRTPVVLRRLSDAAFAPADTAAAVVGRARAFGTLPHPNLLPLLDVGVYDGQPYAVLDVPADTAPLDALLKEIGGAMPGFLAAEFGASVAAALRTVHERGGWHGEVRPAFLFIGPLTQKTLPDGTTRRRPAPNATVKLAETGLTPLHAPAAENPPPADVLAYLPPERLTGDDSDPRSDIYGLGACLYLMLAGRPPHFGATTEELLNKVRAVEPAALVALRPDIPADLAAVVMRMIAKRPADRFQNARELETALAPFCRPGTLPPPPPASVVLMAAPVSTVTAVPVVHVVHPVDGEVVAELEPEPDAWGVDPNAFADAQAASTADTKQPRRRQMTDAEKSRSKIWIAVGLCLHMSAVGLIIAWALGAFTPSPEPTPEPKKEQKGKSTQQPRGKS